MEWRSRPSGRAADDIDRPDAAARSLEGIGRRSWPRRQTHGTFGGPRWQFARVAGVINH
jgi:hypothetical protein